MSAKPGNHLAFSILSLLTAAFCPLARGDGTTLFVSPQGNDAWSGQLSDPNADRTDGPVATPERARDLARASRSRRNTAVPIHVIFRGGTYFLKQPLILTPADSGAKSQPVTWAAHRDEHPVLSGGIRLTTWEKTRMSGRDAWTARLPSELEHRTVRELWVNGQRYHRARWPKQGTLAVAGLSEQEKPGDWTQGVSQFRYRDLDLKNRATASQGEVIVANRWAESHLPIRSIDESNHLISFTKRSVFRLDPGDPYWVENIQVHLTSPGEFLTDSRAKTLTLICPSSVDPRTAQVIVPHLSQVIRMIGDPSAGKLITHVTFRNLEFSHTEWFFDHDSEGRTEPSRKAGEGGKLTGDASRSGFSQAAIGVPAAVWCQGIREVLFDRCTIAHVGTYAIELGQGCRDNRISRCTLTDLGAGGIKLGETVIRDKEALKTAHNEVSDCTITDGGNLFPSCVAVWIGQSTENKISHNDIHGFWYTAISIGWTWGYGESYAHGNCVEFNHIHHIGIKSDGETPILSDMGCVYTLGNHEGTVIRGNVLHDVAGLKYGGWGIYFDEGTTHILAENNLVYRTTHGGFHQHYGKENTVRNNIIAFGRGAQIQRSRVEDHLSFRFERNLVYWDRGPLLAGDWSKLNATFRGNTYWRTEPGAIMFDKWSWAQWRDAGLDRDSRIADPHFASPVTGDFSLSTASSEALSGFVPFDLSCAGPRRADK